MQWQKNKIKEKPLDSNILKINFYKKINFRIIYLFNRKIYA